jgi:MerR family copper efflux transcriptional regulator
MRIGEVSTRSGTSIKTIRYYEEIGVLSQPARSPSGYRDYDDDVIERLQFIRSSKTVGLTLREIREIIVYRDRGEVPCTHVFDLLRRRRNEVAERLKELGEAQIVLDSLVARARNLRPEDCLPNNVCHLIPTAQKRKSR